MTIPLPIPRRNRWLRRIFLFLASIFLLVLVSFIVWRLIIASKVRSRLAAIRQAGYPATIDEVGKLYYGSIPEKENNALSIQAALSKLPSTNGFKGSVPFWTESSGYKLADRAVLFFTKGSNIIAAFLLQNAEVLKGLRESPPGIRSRYPLDLTNPPPNLRTHLASVLDGVRLLVLSSVYNGEIGRTDLSTADLSAAVRLAKSLGDEPLLTSQMTRVKADSMIFDCLRRILTSKAPAEGQISGLAGSFEHAEFPDCMEWAMASERCFGIWAFDHAQLQRSASAQNGYRFMKYSGYLDADFNNYLSIMGKEVAVGKMSFPQRLEAAAAVDKEAETAVSKWHLMSAILIPRYRPAFYVQAEDAAHLRIAQTALAIERYRLTSQNQLPDKLQSLVPAFLVAVPTDPFDGQPLRYKKLAKGYRIYSVGPDGADNGGKEQPLNVPPANVDGYDITFTVERQN